MLLLWPRLRVGTCPPLLWSNARRLCAVLPVNRCHFHRPPPPATELTIGQRNPLPKPPIPSLEHTLERYLQYASVIRLWDRVPAEDVEGAVGRFFPVAEKLQEELKDIAEKEDNWINCFWLQTMYMKPRYPLPVNSNPAYIFPRQQFFDEDDWLLYAAWLAHGVLEFKNLIDRRAISNDSGGLARGRVPYCMDQYDRLLSLYRQPGLGSDVQLNTRYRPANATSVDLHLLVMCENQPFILYVRTERLHARPDGNRPANAGDRAEGAKSRPRERLADCGGDGGQSRRCGRIVDGDAGTRPERELVEFDPKRDVRRLPGRLRGRPQRERAAAGDGRRPHPARLRTPRPGALNRWYDATVQLVISLDGFNGLCMEHSIAEGIVLIRMMEHVLRKVRAERESPVRLPPYGGNDQHQALSWVISENNHQLLEKMATEFDDLAKDLRLTVYEFKEFGKEFIKSNRISPDGFVQLALQLAHYRQHGYLVSSYESATMRRYRYGRVDNIRSATPEALAWVKAMFDRTVSPREKRLLFDNAAKKQALIISENVNGFGIDNHLCALENLAREAVNRGRLPAMPEIFPATDVTPDPIFEGCYLCYGPVVEDGYGCAYSIQSNELLFAISDMKSNPRNEWGRL
ncbi:Carn-acyltransf domain-containing protein [Aphelenchoides fujianensis]|nr:Carn-acyltransf domain-containing protein [Aphelenchoides fujianensis]